jgi:aminoglycoside N3'-acetyltransferase
MQNLIQLVTLHTKHIGAAIALFVLLLGSAYGAETYCHRTAEYFAGFYAGLHKMNSHGFQNFAPNSADQQAYFVQVQKNGEKLEANVIKSIHNDIDISAADKQTYIHITHSLAEKLRSIAESDALKNAFKENDVVLKELVSVCP